MSGNRFINPPPFGQVGEYITDNSTFIGSTLSIQWDYPNTNLSLWLLKDVDGVLCEELNLASTYCRALLPSIQDASQYDWTVSTYDCPYDSSAPAFFFELRTDPSLSSHISSHYFNIVPAAQASYSSSVISSTTSTASSGASKPTYSITSTSASLGSITSSATATSSSSASVTVVPSSSLNAATKAAIGASVGIGVPLIAILLAILIVITRRRKVRDSDNSVSPGAYQPATYLDKPHAQHTVTEVDSSCVYPEHEMEVPMQPSRQEQLGPRWELPGERFR